jgi:hypothetical protein
VIRFVGFSRATRAGSPLSHRRLSRAPAAAAGFTMIDADPNNPAQRPRPSIPTSWEELQLHAWLTVSILYGARRPQKARDVSREDPEVLTDHVRTLLGIPVAGRREVVDVLGNRLVIDNGMVQKMLGDAYASRIPYLPWAPLAPSRAVEVWRQVTISKATQSEAVRDYYLVPIQEDPDYDGFVVIAENSRIFNLMLFRASYADKTLRRNGVLVHKTYSDGLLCTNGCCVSLAKERHELGLLRDENRRLKLQLRGDRKVQKAAALEIARLRTALKTIRPAD